MVPGTTEHAPLLDRLIARWEVSRLAVVPFSLSLLSSSAGLLILVPALLGGRRAALFALILLAVWLMVIGLDQVRGIWLVRHPCASRRWLHGVRAAVGDAMFDDALAHLAILHANDPDYRIARTHLANAVQVALSDRCKKRRQAEGFRLDEVRPGS